ncbi:MAG: hypothetical protein ABGY09_02870 [Euryarchaeota archaeon]
MLIGALLAAISGTLLKLADDLVDRAGRRRAALLPGALAALAAVASVPAGVNPEFYLGLVLGNGVVGKLDEPCHWVAAAAVTVGSVLLAPAGPDAVRLLLVALLAAADELVHPWDPWGLRPVLKVGVVVGWFAGLLDVSVMVAALAFDLGYHAGEIVGVRWGVRAEDAPHRGAGRGTGAGGGAGGASGWARGWV